MISSQLGRAILAGTPATEASDDQQVATVDGRGSYEELVEALDRLIDEASDPGPVS